MEEELMLSHQQQLLSDKQQKVIDLFESGRNVFVTGGAGSGKSYLLHIFRQKYLAKGLEVTASTGIAAVNVGGLTIHSWLGIGLANLPFEQIISNLMSPKFSRIRRRIRMAKALAIDEISMISDKLLDLIDMVLRGVRGNENPMGGLQIVLFGDFLQLPPINKDGANVEFCFKSDVWSSLNLEVVELKGSFRQKDQAFVSMLDDLRFGRIDEQLKLLIKQRIDAKDDGIIKATILTTHNHKVEQINREFMQQIPTQTIEYKAQYSGSDTKIDFLKKNCLAYEDLKLKIGAQVMMIKNTYQKDGVINGSIGVVRDFSAKKSYPIVEFANNKIISVTPEEWLIERFDQDKKLIMLEASMRQIPLVPAWAITVHKSQGLTLDKISCDLSSAFSPSQVYVALSRVRNLSGIFIRSIDFDKIYADKRAINFYENL